MKRQVVVLPGQKVVTTGGEVVTVAFVRWDEVWAFTAHGLLPVQVVYDAWGGEHDLAIAA